MELKIPQYDLKHTRPIVGFGNQAYEIHDSNKGCMIDQSIVAKKFELWDYVLKNNLLSSQNELLRAQAFQLLRDKTILAYAQLKFDGEPIKMYYLQDAILSDPGNRIQFCGCNQKIGKSFCLNVDAATDFMIDHGKNWIGIIVSGSLPQSQFQMDRVKMLLKSSNLTYKEEQTVATSTGKKDNTTQLSYTFYSKDGKTPLYRNLLICCPHTSSALGYPANVLWFDEFDFWENCDQNHFLFQIAIPRTFRTQGKIKVYSNPDGKEKMMYRIRNFKNKDGSPAWHRYEFNYWDAPDATQEEFDQSIVGMTKNQVESTLLAVYTRTEGSFFSTEEIRDMHCSELDQKGEAAGYGKETAWFLDVGSVHDQSALIGGYIEPNPDVPEIPLLKAFYIHKYPVGYPIGRVVGIDQVDKNDGWDEYTEDNPSVKQILSNYTEEYNGEKLQPLFGFDATGNAGMLPLFQAAEMDAVDITFTGKLKWHMYQRYQYYVQQRFIKRGKEMDLNTMRGCDFDYQASKLIVKKNTGTVYKQIHHENEDDLDDTQDACFIAGTLILTDKGQIPIEKLSIGDCVLTRKGYKRIIKTMSQEAKVITKFGITATPTHPFITTSGIEKFKNLNESRVLYKWKGKQLGIKEESIIDIQNQNTHTLEGIIGLIGVTDHQSHYTEIYGRTRSVQSLKVMSSTIKMVARLIMRLRILNLLKKGNMRKYTITKRLEDYLEKIGDYPAIRKLENGMEQKKGKNGIRIIISNLWQKLNPLFSFVNGVKRKLNLKQSMRDFVHQNVMKNKDGKNVRIVYNLEVEDEHEYFANNILVHNCAGWIHLIENPDLPSLSFNIIKHGNEENKEGEKVEEPKDERLNGQYIPSFMDKGELSSWMDQREELR